jgi:hypothetical protein
MLPDSFGKGDLVRAASGVYPLAQPAFKAYSQNNRRKQWESRKYF